MNNFKPQLLPNNKKNVSPDWESLLDPIETWVITNKLDGARIELFNDGKARSRTLEVISNVHIQKMAEEVNKVLNIPQGVILEAEFYAKGMNFSEVMHFFRSQDVESEKTLKKYTKLWEKTKGSPELGWPYPGRDLKWCTTWNKDLKFYVFDMVYTDNLLLNKLSRLDIYVNAVIRYKNTPGNNGNLEYIPRINCQSIDSLYQAYDQSILDGYEGLVAIQECSKYKYGRITLNSKEAFKLKDDNKEYDGIILSVVQGTIARPGAEKKVNKLGRSKTSQLKQDRIPSNMATGFEVKLEDGKILTVNLNGFNHSERREMLKNHLEYSNKHIKFHAMAPVKESGVPRHAIFTKGNIRDDKL